MPPQVEPFRLGSPRQRAEVGLGEWAVSTRRDQELVAFGLGSCVGLVLFHPDGVAGLAHVVLPESRGDELWPAKYADTAVGHLVREMARRGCEARRLTAFLVGGAAMFPLAQLPDIGAANAARLRAELRALGIPLAGEDVGGARGRTLRVDAGTGRVTVASAGEPPRHYDLARGRAR